MPHAAPMNAGPLAGLRIEPLGERPAAANVIARWFLREWHSQYGAFSQEEVAAEMREGLEPGALPLVLVASIVSGGAPETIGTAALKAEAFGGIPAQLGIPGPWLGGLIVAPAHRHRGVATALIDRAAAEARAMGHPALFAGTHTAQAVFEAAGWRDCASFPWDGALATVYERTL